MTIYSRLSHQKLAKSLEVMKLICFVLYIIYVTQRWGSASDAMFLRTERWVFSSLDKSSCNHVVIQVLS